MVGGGAINAQVLIKVKYRLCRPIELLLIWLEDRVIYSHWKFSICPDCGRNRYTGAPCKNTNENERMIR